MFSNGSRTQVVPACEYRLRGQSNDRRLVSGVAITMDKTVVSESSTTQDCVTLLTWEADYIAMTHGAKAAFFSMSVLFVRPHLCEIMLMCTRITSAI